MPASRHEVPDLLLVPGFRAAPENGGTFFMCTARGQSRS